MRQDNCFPWIADWAQAQRLMDRPLKAHGPKLLNGIARQLNPIHREICHQHPVSYYWPTYQSEWAIDIVFREAADLRRLYPRGDRPRARLDAAVGHRLGCVAWLGQAPARLIHLHLE